tara:strand:- start:273 stop:860 length:588 start_codon:yes stop_codon:yes gene_type:complete
MKTGLKLIGGEKIESPKSDKTRPTTLMVREALFNILSKNVVNSNWLDLFSGTGAVSCEAYNHGAKLIIAVEKDRLIAELCKKNLLSLNDSHINKNNIQVICKDVFSWLKSSVRENDSKHSKSQYPQFDYIYIDPPYASDLYEVLLEELFNSCLITESTIVICEHIKSKQIKNNNLWKVKDIRTYGQTTLTFLIKI